MKRSHDYRYGIIAAIGALLLLGAAATYAAIKDDMKIDKVNAAKRFIQSGALLIAREKDLVKGEIVVTGEVMTSGAAVVSRVQSEKNVRFEFDVNNPSYHPVVTKGRNANVPSLIHPLTDRSLIYCTSCHNSDRGRGAGGSGADGPHG